MCDGEEVTKDSDISDAFNNYFSAIGSKLASKIHPSNIDFTSCIHQTDKVFTSSEMNVATVSHLLKAINVNKATGPDNIPGRLLKIVNDVLSPSLTVISNKSLATGIYPDDRNIAKVYLNISMEKKLSYVTIDLFRLFLQLQKFLGKILFDQFYSYLINNELLSEYQSGFRPSYSTLTALLETTNN